jgi:hypothetical protein
MKCMDTSSLTPKQARFVEEYAALAALRTQLRVFDILVIAISVSASAKRVIEHLETLSDAELLAIAEQGA